MEYKMKYISIAIILILQCAILGAQDTGKYEYPLNPSMPEWKNLSTEVKNKMLQIPEDKLKSMPTEQLIQAYIDNPFCSLMFAFNSFQEGFKRVYNEFNGLRELLQRNDSAMKIVDFYKNMQVDAYDANWKTKKKGQFTFNFIYIEMLLSQPEIIRQLRPDEARILVKELIEKYNQKVEHVSEHSILGISYCVYAIGHTLQKNERLTTQGVSVNENIISFLANGQFSQGEILDEIMQKAKAFTQN